MRSRRLDPIMESAARRSLASSSAPGAGRRGRARTVRATGDGLEQFVELLDSRFRLPILGVRFGLDSIIGLIPGVGDVAGSLLGLVVLAQARREGAAAATLARMTVNLIVDAILGALPLVGDIADLYYKAHSRNLKLLRQDRARRGR